MSQDYYNILGVEKGADDAALKKAYRKQAMKYHPDRNPDDKVAEQKFKEVNEAYDTLKDPQKRSAYDQFGHEAYQQAGAGQAGGAGFGGFGGFGGGGAGFSDIFEDLFGDAFGGGTGPVNNRGADLRYNLSISLEEAYNGGNIKIKVPTMGSCEVCHGSGAKPGSSPTTCSTCGGHGQVRMSQGFFNMTRPCPTCGGSGQVIKDPCTNCHGQGRVQQEKIIDVKIPKGVDSGNRMRLSGQGEAGTQGGEAGDLYIVMNIKPHKIFQRAGDNLHLDVPICMTDAALGGTVDVPTPDGGRAKLAIPEGTQSGDKLRLRGKGMPVLNRGNFGDLIVTVRVETPTKLSKKQREAMENLRAEIGRKNAPQQEGFMEKIKKFVA